MAKHNPLWVACCSRLGGEGRGWEMDRKEKGKGMEKGEGEGRGWKEGKRGKERREGRNEKEEEEQGQRRAKRK